MLVMTTKVDKKKCILIVAAIAAVILLGILLFSGSDSTATSAPGSITGNDDRVRFLESFGWEVVTTPAETSQVRIPQESNQVFQRYNQLQKTMGYDLSAFSGKTVMRYVYKIKNYPGATESVYATLLICNNQIIGGDVTDTSTGGKIQSFRMGGE